MASIADKLGVAVDTSNDPAVTFSLGEHAARQIRAKGFDRAAVLAAANNPAHTYDNGRYPGQKRHIRGDICAVVDVEAGEIVTVYTNTKVTALRADQARDRNTAQRADALGSQANRLAGFYASLRKN